MVQALQAHKKNKGSKSKAKSKFAIKHCLFCNEPYKGSPQSVYCSKYHMECASRCRKEALIDVLESFLLEHSQQFTLECRGVAIQATREQARRKAEQCIKQNHQSFKYKLMALGYVYNERDRQWLLQPRLVQ